MQNYGHKSKFSMNFPHFAVYLFVDASFPTNGRMELCKLLKGFGTNLSQQVNTPYDKKEGEVINPKKYLAGLGLYTNVCLGETNQRFTLEYENTCTCIDVGSGHG